ncbi:RES domain-containing protein [Hymenobacter sp. HSC-4F20]|uniref:RES domain-containing protein n=1 Tax=Hymenobacter sp. HSC-4F20 TaxID=2864135 RepID=UPI001C731FEC|nr:RES domain-containing protein [Hymenobacter sp. HSC-4F20]MBX0289041.1 RES domain-containing protein [Hymenobacter sp. HSC-4F20]
MRPSSFPPDVVRVQRQLRALRHLSLRRHSISELAARVRRLLTGHPVRCIELPAGVLVYRGVAREQPPTYWSEVSYPPPERVHYDQRMNRAGQPMFYASATWHPPFFEAGVQPDDQILISRWISRAPLRLVSFHEPDQCADDPHSDRNQLFGQAWAALPEPARLVSAFLTRVFIRPVSQQNAHHYRLSIAVAEACELGSAFDGILYPSAAMTSPAHNLALHPSCLDTGKLELQYVEQLRVNRVGIDELDVCSLNFANRFDKQGRLQWLNQPGNWVLREAGHSTIYYRQPTGKWNS